MNSQKIAIITDTGTNVPASFAAAHDVREVALRINYSDGTSYQSGIDITADELVARLHDEIPTTSLPSPSQIRAAFENARADGYNSAVFITISAGLSATNQTVRMVADQLSDFPVIVVNTKSIGVAAGMTVMAAAQMIEDGVAFGQLEQRLNALARNTWVFFTTKTLRYLRHGGRISEPVYRLGSMLNIKPVITCNDAGHYVVARKARGWERAITTEANLAIGKAEQFKRVRLAICCSSGNDYFEKLESELRAALEPKGIEIEEVIRCSFSPDLLVHTGPDAVGVAVQGLA